MSVLHDHRWLAQVTEEEGHLSKVEGSQRALLAELKEARAELERLQAEIERLKRQRAFNADAFRDVSLVQRELNAENDRLRAALEVFANREHWRSRTLREADHELGRVILGVEWVGDNDNPRAIAQEALQPPPVEAGCEAASGLTMDQRKEIAQHVWDKCGLELMEIGSRPRAGEAEA